MLMFLLLLLGVVAFSILAFFYFSRESSFANTADKRVSVTFGEKKVVTGSGKKLDTPIDTGIRFTNSLDDFTGVDVPQEKVQDSLTAKSGTMKKKDGRTMPFASMEVVDLPDEITERIEAQAKKNDSDHAEMGVWLDKQGKKFSNPDLDVFDAVNQPHSKIEARDETIERELFRPETTVEDILHLCLLAKGSYIPVSKLKKVLIDLRFEPDFHHKFYSFHELKNTYVKTIDGRSQNIAPLVCSITNANKPGTLLTKELGELQTNKLFLFFDLRRSPSPKKQFLQVVQIGKIIAEAIDASLMYRPCHFCHTPAIWEAELYNNQMCVSSKDFKCARNLLPLDARALDLFMRSIERIIDHRRQEMLRRTSSRKIIRY